ncbi:MAG: radical SAM protein [Acetobacteraceae bacterium]|nr:radical SAM protein [Acetobacteraceae bacterium]
MRLSRYNLVTASDRGETLMFNPWTCAMVGLQPDFYRRYLDPEHGDPNLAPEGMQREFLFGHFAVPDGVDELQQYRFERARASFATDRLDLVVAPTLDCNLACVYCYEQARRPGVMPAAVIQAVKDLVSRRLRAASSLRVTWYGGEPLLALGVIEELAGWLLAQARARGADYESRVITNGLLLSPRVARGLQALGVNLIQVSLDGPQELHDRRRPRLGGQGTFEAIMENLASLPPGLHLVVRVAVDRQNQERVWEFYEMLQRRLPRRCQVLIRPVSDSPGVCRSAASSCMSAPEFLSWYLSSLRDRLDRGRSVAGLDDMYPRPNLGCMGTQLSQVMVDPDGNMQRCLEEVGMRERTVGSVDRPLLFGPVLQEWMALDPLAVPRCRQCHILPMCSGGCPARWIRAGQPECTPYLALLPEVMRLHDRWPAGGGAKSASGG